MRVKPTQTRGCKNRIDAVASPVGALVRESTAVAGAEEPGEKARTATREQQNICPDVSGAKMEKNRNLHPTMCLVNKFVRKNKKKRATVS